MANLRFFHRFLIKYTRPLVKLQQNARQKNGLNIFGDIKKAPIRTM